jgi:hypothetical protein
MIIKTSELQGSALDWAVAKVEGNHITFDEKGFESGSWEMYSSNWAQGGPIIERLGICIKQSKAIKSYHWCAGYGDRVSNWFYGDTPLIAAMRCYVASKLGEEVEVPNELA